MDPQAFLATIEDFHWLDYERLLGRWSAVLGRERVAVGGAREGPSRGHHRRLPRPARHRAEGIEDDDERINDSLPVHMLEIARHLGLYEIRAAGA